MNQLIHPTPLLIRNKLPSWEGGYKDDYDSIFGAQEAHQLIE